MHPYTKDRLHLFNIYKWLLLVSFFISLSIGYFTKQPEVKSIFIVVKLFFAGMPLLVVSLVYTIFVKFIWKWKPINKFIKVPNINGTYIGTLKSSFGNLPKERKFKLKISQDFVNISIVMKMIEGSSESYSINAYLEQKSDEILLIYVYQNEPINKTSPTLTEHKGTTILKFRPDAMSFVGNYFTDKRPINDKEAVCNYGELRGKRVNNDS